MRERRISVEECPLKNSHFTPKRSRNLKGPLRVVRLCLLGILLPAILVAVPLYMRYRVYGYQLYPLAMSDMRLLDNKVSTTWCQRQLVKVNTTFNAFLLPQPPQILPEKKTLSMIRHLVLEDDTKEYWGFYLLRGSKVTVSTCVRWPGASLIVLRGHKHLHECAYIGDNSSEELEEMIEAILEGSYVPQKNENITTDDDSPSNQPDLMMRHHKDVEFHHPDRKNNSKPHNLKGVIDTDDITDPQTMKRLLEALQEKVGKSSRKKLDVVQEDHVHVKRNSTVTKGERNNLEIAAPNFKKGQKTVSEEVLQDIINKLEVLGTKGEAVLDKVNKQYNGNHSKNVSKNTFENLVHIKGRHYEKPPVEYNDNIDRARRRRDVILSSRLAAELNTEDENENLGIEEGFSPDGIADHRGTINETTPNDMSNSEFWSSFSSSEETLLNCAGLILNLPLTPHHKCSVNLTDEEAEEAYLANSVTYSVPVNGYYFFVFNSENEVQPNYIRVQFHLKKSVYNVSNPVSSCFNSSEKCAMDLNFFSSEKLVMELPVKDNDSLWNEEFIVVSECEPRTAIYVFCVITVPVLVILFAFT